MRERVAGYEPARNPQPYGDGGVLVARRIAALRSWSLLLSRGQAEGLRKWVLYGDLSDVADVHRGLVDEWEADR